MHKLIEAPLGMLHIWKNGEMGHVPEGFIFPSHFVCIMWNLSLYGNPSLKICPYRFLSPKTDLVSSDCRINFCRTKKVMEKMVSIEVTDKIVGSAKEFYTKANDILQKQTFNKIFEGAYKKLIEDL